MDYKFVHWEQIRTNERAKQKFVHVEQYASKVLTRTVRGVAAQK